MIAQKMSLNPFNKYFLNFGHTRKLACTRKLKKLTAVSEKMFCLSFDNM